MNENGDPGSSAEGTNEPVSFEARDLGGEFTTITSSAALATGYRESLDIIAGRILGLLDERGPEDRRLAAALLLKDAEERIEDGEEPEFPTLKAWCKVKLPGHGERDIRRLLAIAKSPDPKKAMAEDRAKNAQHQKQHRAKNKAAANTAASSQSGSYSQPAQQASATAAQQASKPAEHQGAGESVNSGSGSTGSQGATMAADSGSADLRKSAPPTVEEASGYETVGGEDDLANNAANADGNAQNGDNVEINADPVFEDYLDYLRDRQQWPLPTRITMTHQMLAAFDVSIDNLVDSLT
jgi:hypothetical protein